MSDIFVSYASEDRAKAQTLAQLFENKGWSTFWDRTIRDTYAIFGGPSLAALDAADGNEDGMLELANLDGSTGFRLDGVTGPADAAGDINSDGFDDLIIGAPGGDPNGESSGETYVVYGGPFSTEPSEGLIGEVAHAVTTTTDDFFVAS